MLILSLHTRFSQLHGKLELKILHLPSELLRAALFEDLPIIMGANYLKCTHKFFFMPTLSWESREEI